MTDGFYDEVNRAINDLERKLEIEQGFHQSLLHADDWSFVLKIHTLIESSSTHTILAILGRHELDAFISKLSQHNRNQILLKISELNKDQCRRIELIGKVRNAVMHNIKNADFSLADYFNDLDTSSIDRWINSFDDQLSMFVIEKDQKVELMKAAAQSIIWHGTLVLLWQFSMEADAAQRARSRDEGILSAVRNGEPIPN